MSESANSLKGEEVGPAKEQEMILTRVVLEQLTSGVTARCTRYPGTQRC